MCRNINYVGGSERRVVHSSSIHESVVSTPCIRSHRIMGKEKWKNIKIAIPSFVRSIRLTCKSGHIEWPPFEMMFKIAYKKHSWHLRQVLMHHKCAVHQYECHSWNVKWGTRENACAISRACARWFMALHAERPTFYENWMVNFIVSMHQCKRYTKIAFIAIHWTDAGVDLGIGCIFFFLSPLNKLYTLYTQIPTKSKAYAERVCPNRKLLNFDEYVDR